MVLQYIRFVLLAMLLGAAVALNEEDVGNANKYIDTVLENLKKEPEIKKHIDPVKIPDYGSVDTFHLKNIRINGLSQLSREGDCSLSYKDKTVNLVAEMAVRGVSLTLDYTAKRKIFWIPVYYNGDIRITFQHLQTKIDISSIDGNAKIDSLKVTDLGSYKMDRFTGLSFLLNWLVKLIVNSVANKARDNIISALENQGKDALNNILSQYKLPIY